MTKPSKWTMSTLSKLSRPGVDSYPYDIGSVSALRAAEAFEQMALDKPTTVGEDVA